MLRARHSNGVFSIELDMRSLSSIWRVIALAAVDAWSWGMHPASPYKPIVLRNRVARGRS
jgi:hypothetical protein